MLTVAFLSYVPPEPSPLPEPPPHAVRVRARVAAVAVPYREVFLRLKVMLMAERTLSYCEDVKGGG
ncbi:hypothetical protein [Streptomyces jeddahensis]|uniref:Uncharacterized protein n=1 Tax=Streptomyces jeddahensis TaxID=1716141 RepID=A0A177HQ11_9ACTN|nr:hypothetical protein [Streptomyces jeddahensis]OAH12294.1 hypothetical protein STSP_43270 [Streptomyces jeddahensis]